MHLHGQFGAGFDGNAFYLVSAPDIDAVIFTGSDPELSGPTHNFHFDSLFHRRFSQLQHTFGHLLRKIILPAIVTRQERF